MLDQVLQDYEQQKEKHMAESLNKSRKRKEGHQLWFQQKREESLLRKEAEEMRRQFENQKMEEKKQQIEKALLEWKALDQERLANQMAAYKEKTL